MKSLISAVILLGSVQAFAFGEFNQEIQDLATQNGYPHFSNYCEASSMYGQGAKGSLDMTIHEYKNDKGKAVTIVNYMINESGAEHYDMTDIIPLPITKAIQSKDVVGTRIEVLLEDQLIAEDEMLSKMNVQIDPKKPEGYGSGTIGALVELLTGQEPSKVKDEQLELKRINLNKFTKSYELNDDVYIECDKKI